MIVTAWELNLWSPSSYFIVQKMVITSSIQSFKGLSMQSTVEMKVAGCGDRMNKPSGIHPRPSHRTLGVVEGRGRHWERGVHDVSSICCSLSRMHPSQIKELTFKSSKYQASDWLEESI